MGKLVPKSKSNKEDEMDELDDDIDELYRPYLIHSTTYALLTEQILSLMPSDRNVLLTMNEYDLSEINPMHPNTADSPTHIIIFCIRFVAGDMFQPIGGLLTYKYKDQSVVLAECLKAYINDLWKLGLHVVGTVSPPFESFKGMLSHLIDVKDFNTYAGTLVYSVNPIKEIVHIYDIQFLLIKLQNLFKEGDIKFMEGTREYTASWNDISSVMNLSSEFKVLSNYLLDNKDVSRRVHIFTQQIFEQLLELEAQDALSEDAGGCAVLLNCVRSFLQFTELDLVDLKIMCKVAGWDNFTTILPTMVFQKSKKRTCTKTKPSTIHVLTKPSTRRKIDFHIAENLENLVQEKKDFILFDELEENDYEKVVIGQADGKSTNNRSNSKKTVGKNKRKKDKSKNPKQTIVSEKIENKAKLHTKKPYDVQKPGKTIFKKTNTSANAKTDFDTIKTTNTQTKLLEKTENEHNNLICDVQVDDNNNDEGLQGKTAFENRNRTDKQIEIKEENFDVVINDAQKFFESFFITYKPPNDSVDSNTGNIPQTVEPNETYDDFCSQTDEETENCVTRICDKVPTLVEALDKEEDAPDEFECNDVTCELLCTVFGMKKLMENLIRRRVKTAKPDAFVVEHIDFLVTIIKRDKNGINPVYYYGHNYGFLNSELAFSTLQNNIGLFLVKT